MSTLNIVCPICADDFKNSDKIYSTYCGHVFHKDCLGNWTQRRSNCPMCRHEFYGQKFDHEIFLSVEVKVSLEELEELKLKLRSTEEKNDQLQVQINEMEINFLQLQEQYTACEQLKKKLEKQIKEKVYNDENFLRLQHQYTESMDEINNLKDLIQQLSIENEEKSKELSVKSNENSSFKTVIAELGGELSDNVLKEKIKVLEQKLKYFNEQTEIDITSSSELSTDKIKLERYIDCLNVKNTAKHATRNSVIIDNFPLEHIKYPLKNIIVDLGKKMYLPICPDDLNEVKIFERTQLRGKFDSETALLVKFKTSYMKTKFLANKDKLLNYPVIRSLIVIEYVDDRIYSLFIYAKEKLKNNEVFCKDNKVFAKRNDNRKSMQIYNKKYVDNFLQRQAPVTNILQKLQIDENFYQLATSAEN